jgi:peptidoglycan L-alanyl-D-glutamate endopeptidase CwlK
MPSFGQRSLERLNTCHRDLQTIAHEVIKTHDFMVIYGFRNEQEQQDAFERRTSPYQWPDSKHNRMPSIAIDVAPYPIDWDDEARFIELANMWLLTAKRLDILCRWGGDWNMDGIHKRRENDLGHFEMVT